MTRTAITMFLLMIVVIGGDVATSPSAWAAGDPTPANCNVEGNRSCGVGGPHGPRPDGSCPEGGTPGTGGMGKRTCDYAGGSATTSGKRGKKAEPCTPATCSRPLNLNDARGLPADYVDPSYASRRPAGLSGPGGH